MGSHLKSKQNTTAVVQDFFALVDAAAGDAPLLQPFPFRKEGKMAHYEINGNDGVAMRNIFFAEDVEKFIKALASRTARYRHIRQPRSQLSRLSQAERDRIQPPCPSVALQLSV